MKTVDIASEFPTAAKAMNSLSIHVGKALSDAGLDPVLPELVRIRVSQINGCAFCLRMHSRDAIEKGRDD